MKSKNMLIFTAVVAVVVGYSVYDYWSSEKAEKEKSTQSLLLGYPADQISEFRIQTKDNEIQMKKGVDGWQMLKPVVDDGNNNAADKFVEGVATEKFTETVVEGDKVNLSQFGLDQPKGTLTVIHNNGTETQFKVGTLRNFQGDSYVQKNNEPKVLLASSTWFAKFEKSPSDFRDKRLMRISNSGAQKISIQKGKESIELSKKGDDWILSSHPDWKLDQNKVRELLLMLHTTEAIEFVTGQDVKKEELQKWGLANPRLEVTVDLKDKGTWAADFAVSSDHIHRVHVHKPDFVLKISPTDSDKFYQMSVDGFRDTSEPFNFDKSQVKNVDIKLARGQKQLKNDNDKVHDLISQISNLKVAQFGAPSKGKLDQEIVLKNEKNDILKLQWGEAHEDPKTKEKLVTAKSSLYPQAFSLKESDINNLKLDELVKKESGK